MRKRLYMCIAVYPVAQSALNRKMTIISVANSKGGVGKTTCAIHLAALLVRDGPPLLVDADQNQSAVLWAKAGQLAFTVVAEKASRKAMMSGKYKYIIADSQLAPDSGEAKALCDGSDLLIVPTTPDAPALAATGRLFRELGTATTSNGQINAIALITMAPPLPQSDAADAVAALTDAGIPVFKRHIRNGKAYKRAFELGVALSQMGSKHRAGQLWRDWIELGTELEELISDA